METNSCETIHLDSNVLLPPRKRLLAGLKKQNPEANFDHPSTSCTSVVLEAQISDLMSSHLGNPNLSLEKAVEASRAAATSALDLAVRARAVAVDKAEIAARAMAAAKRALDLVASISEDEENKERYLKKNPMKKHLPVQRSYSKKRLLDNPKTDEELARSLHRVINSSPRILKCPPGLKSSKNKRLKLNGNGFMSEGHDVRVDASTSKFDKSKVVGNGKEAGTSHLEENKFKSLDDADTTCRERGRMKQKKLPLSICSFRGRLNLEEEMKSKSSLHSQDNEERTVLNNSPASSVGPRIDGVEKTSMWKSKALQAAVSVKENEVIKS